MNSSATIGRVRLCLALLIAPLVPILALAVPYRVQTGHWTAFPILLVFGYLFFALFGLPAAGVLIHHRTLAACALAGGIVCIAPILLLSLFSLFSHNSIFSPDMLLQLAMLAVVGGLGGAVFWAIAFFNTAPRAADT